MIKQTMNFDQFLKEWPETRKEQFSYEGKKALFDYLEQLSEDTGEDIEFDPIAICCEYTEYKNLKELQADYNDIKTMDELKEKTTILDLDNNKGFIIQQF